MPVSNKPESYYCYKCLKNWDEDCEYGEIVCQDCSWLNKTYYQENCVPRYATNLKICFYGENVPESIEYKNFNRDYSSVKYMSINNFNIFPSYDLPELEVLNLELKPDKGCLDDTSDSKLDDIKNIDAPRLTKLSVKFIELNNVIIKNLSTLKLKSLCIKGPECLYALEDLESDLNSNLANNLEILSIQVGVMAYLYDIQQTVSGFQFVDLFLNPNYYRNLIKYFRNINTLNLYFVMLKKENFLIECAKNYDICNLSTKSLCISVLYCSKFDMCNLFFHFSKP